MAFSGTGVRQAASALLVTAFLFLSGSAIAASNPCSVSNPAVVGACCDSPGATKLSGDTNDVLACLSNPSSSNQIASWFKYGTNSIPTCKDGYALNLVGGTFQCQPETMAFPTCTSSQALSYNGTSFVCVTPSPPPPPPPQCPFTNTVYADCPAGYQGSIATTTTIDCNGIKGTSTTNSCVPVGTLTTVTTVTCTIGSTYYGTLTGGVFAYCGGSDPGCRTYVCTAGGLQ